MPRSDIIVVGASTRSAAASLVSAGWQPICFDLFGDRDLRQFAEVHVLDSLDDAVSALDRLVPMLGCRTPVIYTGGMENRPDVVAELESRWTLWGCSAQSLRGIRDPFQLADVLHASGCETLDVSHVPTPAKDWIIKPVQSGGGQGIKKYDPSQTNLVAGQFAQEFRCGEPMSALFLARQDDRGRCTLVGVCRQLIGESFLNAPEFGWCGSMGNVPVCERTQRQLQRIGQVLHNAFQLAGLFGVDFILDDDGIPWVTEVNPRYTGSVEVLERALRVNLMTAHIDAMQPHGVERNLRSVPPRTSQRVVGKAILFAPTDLVADTDDWRLPDPSADCPLVVDVPIQGQRLPAGSPICSLLSSATLFSDCLHELRSRSLQIVRETSFWREFVRF